MKKRRFKVKNVLLITFLIYGSMVVFPRPQAVSGQNPLRVGNQRQPLIIAHGGGNHEFPDNTLEAYYHAYGISDQIMLETDVNNTRDGVLILSHDRTLDRKTNLFNALIEDIDYTYLVNNEVDFGFENPIDGPNGFNISQTFRQYTNYAQQTVTPLDVIYPDGVTARHPSKFLVTTFEELILAFPNSLINVEIKQLGEIGRAHV
jgi:glycerophosphoryl diester phosphodiesterase